jgi:hypothetical protein
MFNYIMVNRIKRTKKTNKYYTKIMNVMMNKIDKRRLSKKDKKLFKSLLDNLHEICEIFTPKK